jgi:hypothetical protein
MEKVQIRCVSLPELLEGRVVGNFFEFRQGSLYVCVSIIQKGGNKRSSRSEEVMVSKPKCISLTKVDLGSP